MTNTNTPAGNISAAPRYKARWLTVCGFLMAMNTVLSSFNIPVPGGHFYLNDVIIVAAALSLDPLGAFLVGGVGAFLGDFFFYPLPMFVSLATHGLEAVVISLFARRYGKKNLPLTFFGVFLGAFIVVIGYSLGRAYVYSTPEYSLIKLPLKYSRQASVPSSARSSGKTEIWETPSKKSSTKSKMSLTALRRFFISFAEEAVRLISYFLFWYNNTERIFTRRNYENTSRCGIRTSGGRCPRTACPV